MRLRDYIRAFVSRTAFCTKIIVYNDYFRAPRYRIEIRRMQFVRLEISTESGNRAAECQGSPFSDSNKGVARLVLGKRVSQRERKS